MDDLKTVIASNLIALRTGAGMTQAELAEKLNYSDKSVSKWERAEGLPDVGVLLKMSEIFSVPLDYLVSFHEKWEPPKKEKRTVNISTRLITAIAIAGVWTVALFVFIVFWMNGQIAWLAFIHAIPVSLVTLLVLNSVWEEGRHNFYIIGALILSVLTAVYLTNLSRNWWQLFLLAVPAAAVLLLCAWLHRQNHGEKTRQS